MHKLENQIVESLVGLFEEDFGRKLTKEEKLQILKNWDKFKISLDR